MTKRDGQILATDLDGTLIPLAGNEKNQADLIVLADELEQRQITLIYVTGRHFESFEKAKAEFDLPSPHWVICDVGTSIYTPADENKFQTELGYQAHLAQVVASLPTRALREYLSSIDGIRLQEGEKQGLFKLSYYTNATQLAATTTLIQQKLDKIQAPYTLINSVDPFNGDGLIDLIPLHCSKAYALKWLTQHIDWAAEHILYAGDSGNDFEALTSNFRSILVANADRELARRIRLIHEQRQTEDCLYLARESATSGVLEGCRWFGLLENDSKIDQLGAVVVGHNATHFRVWAPNHSTVEVEFQTDSKKQRTRLMADNQGYFFRLMNNVAAGSRYKFVLDNIEVYPDPASRSQPDGVFGCSQVVDHNSFAWSDDKWTGIEKKHLIIYELHIGTFTQEGTLLAAIDRLPNLVDLGITAVEVMPVSQSPGRWNWGYDGVYPFAVRDTYGGPDAFKEFVNACHLLGIAVILDVVYNHLGPEGNYLRKFGPYFCQEHSTPWGDAFNFDGDGSDHVRRFIIENAIYWLDEYHLDGLRLDAVHFMFDESETSILQEIHKAVHDFKNSVDREVHLIAETNVFDKELICSTTQESFDAIWCDCLMHSIYSHASSDFCTDREYQGANDLVQAMRNGYVFVGKARQRAPKHTCSNDQLSNLASIVVALQNHDVIGSHPLGKRIHQVTSIDYQMAAATLVLLHPGIPLMFMGEERASESTFPFFADFDNESLRYDIERHRMSELRPGLADQFVSPFDPDCFFGAKLRCGDRSQSKVTEWYRDLIHLRKKGISDGWLVPQNRHFEYDADAGVFWLEYSNEQYAVSAHIRLTPVGKAESPPIKISCSSKNYVLMSSKPLSHSRHLSYPLDMNHAVIQLRSQ